MSMIGNFEAITEAQLNAFLKDPDSVATFLYSEGNDRMRLDIDKAWHGIHFLLTGDAWGGTPPLSWAVMGATEIGEDVGYGPARYLTPKQVKEVAHALSNISKEDLAKRFNPKAFSDADIYPSIWENGEDECGYLMSFYEELRGFYNEASSKSLAMLTYVN